MPQSFFELVEARKTWIDGVLKPWCRQASRIELLKAHDEWHDIAGRVDQEFTLWLWAWSRFPALYVDELKGLDESYEVRITLKDSRQLTGFPDARESHRGMLVLFSTSETGSRHAGPISIDDIASVEHVGALQ